MPEEKKVENYVLPADLVGRMVEILNTLPYGRVAVVMGRLGPIIEEQNKMAKASPDSLGNTPQ